MTVSSLKYVIEYSFHSNSLHTDSDGGRRTTSKPDTVYRIKKETKKLQIFNNSETRWGEIIFHL